jgi:Tol biopolymer transport system component
MRKNAAPLGLFCILGIAGCQSPGFPLVADTTPEKDWPAAEAKTLTNVRQITSEDMGIGASGEAYFSPDMRRIIFQSYPREKHDYQMFTLELNPELAVKSGTLRQVSPGPGACTCGYFRPDGKGIIYASSYLDPDMPNPNHNRFHRSGRSYVWAMPGGMEIIAADLDGSNPRPLTRVQGYDAECAFSPDGKHIVFTSDRAGNPDLYIMNADGSNVRRLTNMPGYDGGPFFSPDGKRIIFRSDRHGNDLLQVFVINTDGSGERQLTRDSPVVNWAPFWLPDGRSVVFTTSIHGHYNYEVYLLNIETGRQHRVTYSPRFDGLPVVSPDGKQMMWTSQRSPTGVSQIFIADFHRPDGF